MGEVDILGMMKFKIGPEIFALFPELTIGVLTVQGIDNHGEEAKIANLLRQAEKNTKSEFIEGQLGADPRLTSWRQAYRKFGCDPHDYRPSVEALVRRVVKGDQIRHINKLVDLYNLISLEYILPVGGENLVAVRGDIVLTRAEGDEPFIPLGITETEYPEKGEVIYKDTEGTLCRRFNWREGDRTKIEETTTNAILEIEGLPPTTKEKIKKATEKLADLIKKHCGGQVEIYLLNKENQEVEFD